MKLQIDELIDEDPAPLLMEKSVTNMCASFITELQGIYSIYARRSSTWVDRGMRPHSFSLLSGHFWQLAIDSGLVNDHVITLARYSPGCMGDKTTAMPVVCHAATACMEHCSPAGHAWAFVLLPGADAGLLKLQSIVHFRTLTLVFGYAGWMRRSRSAPRRMTRCWSAGSASYRRRWRRPCIRSAMYCTALTRSCCTGTTASCSCAWRTCGTPR